MDAEEQSSRREAWRQRVRNLRIQRGKEKGNVQRKFLFEVANAGGNIEEAKVTVFDSNLWQQK